MQGLDQLKVDVNDLYIEEVITDLKVATIRRLTPIKTDGSKDPSRQVIFSASTNVMSPGGMIPVNCELEAKTLDEAIRKFPDGIKKAVEEMIAEVEEYRRQSANRIVVAPSAAMPGGAGPAGPGKGKIVLG